MIEKIKMMAVNLLLKRYALGYLVKAWNKINGYRTQICFGLMIAVYIAEKFGYIDAQLSANMQTALAGGGTFSFLEKMKKYDGIINSGVKMVKEEADKNEGAPK